MGKIPAPPPPPPRRPTNGDAFDLEAWAEAEADAYAARERHRQQREFLGTLLIAFAIVAAILVVIFLAQAGDQVSGMATLITLSIRLVGETRGDVERAIATSSAF